MLNIDAISKGFGNQLLFDAAALQINPGERVGLVGRNGHGKTTLLNMVIGRDQPDEGQVILPSGYRMGYLSQKIEFTRPTVREEAMLGLPEHERDQAWKVEKILTGLGFSMTDMDSDPCQFSGGYQVRLNLAKVLVSDPDLLILDEPTNYLDITSIRWIKQFLNAWPREVMLVTHDRGFMDAVATHIAGIHRRKIKKVKGSTQKYYDQVAQDEEIYEKTRLNEEKKRKEVELFISRFRAKARLANMVQSRIKTLEKNQPKEKLMTLKNLDFSFNYQPFSGKQVMIAEGLEFGWDKSKPLISDLSFTIQPQDRIAIIGRNGKGKTTLLRLLNGDLESDQGRIQVNPGVIHDCFVQTNTVSLNPSFTIEEELMLSSDSSDRQRVRNICGAMMFEKDAALKKISVLSGGEKARVMLGKLLLSPLNLLFLDEPSNHLDIESCDALVAAVDAFEGAVVIVTHNEMFLHALANRLIVFKDGRVTMFDGTYREFLDKEGWGENAPLKEAATATIQSQKTKKQIRQEKSRIIKEKSKQLSPLKKQINGLENQIEKNDQIIQKTEQELLFASENADADAIARLSKELAKAQQDNEKLYDALEVEMESFEKIETMFHNQLSALEKES